MVSGTRALPIVPHAACLAEARRRFDKERTCQIRPCSVTASRNENGYFWITGRVDDVVNVPGHRLSTAEIGSALVSHPAVRTPCLVSAGKR